MSFLELAKERYSVRKFQDREITQSDMDKILEAANVAPTGCNYQPQRIYVVKSKENLAKLNELCKCIFGAKTVLMFTYRTDEEWHNPLEKGAHSGIQDVSVVACACYVRGLGTWHRQLLGELFPQFKDRGGFRTPRK